MVEIQQPLRHQEERMNLRLQLIGQVARSLDIRDLDFPGSLVNPDIWSAYFNEQLNDWEKGKERSMVAYQELFCDRLAKDVSALPSDYRVTKWLEYMFGLGPNEKLDKDKLIGLTNFREGARRTTRLVAQNPANVAPEPNAISEPLPAATATEDAEITAPISTLATVEDVAEQQVDAKGEVGNLGEATERQANVGEPLGGEGNLGKALREAFERAGKEMPKAGAQVAPPAEDWEAARKKFFEDEEERRQEELKVAQEEAVQKWAADQARRRSEASTGAQGEPQQAQAAEPVRPPTPPHVSAPTPKGPAPEILRRREQAAARAAAAAAAAVSENGDDTELEEKMAGWRTAADAYWKKAWQTVPARVTPPQPTGGWGNVFNALFGGQQPSAPQAPELSGRDRVLLGVIGRLVTVAINPAYEKGRLLVEVGSLVQNLARSPKNTGLGAVDLRQYLVGQDDVVVGYLKEKYGRNRVELEALRRRIIPETQSEAPLVRNRMDRDALSFFGSWLIDRIKKSA